MFWGFKKLVSRYARNEAGQFAIVIALLGLPLVVIGGYAVDINKIVGKKAHISAALDAAALASVIPADLDQEERESFARQVFAENYFGDIPVSLEVEASRELVKITGTSYIPTLFGGIVGSENLNVSDTATAELTRADVVCVLALDPTGERAIQFLDKARFNSPACSVQVNSTNELAMVSDVAVPPVAKSFCAGGVSRGEFAPFVKHACSPIADPYAHLTPPEDEPCIDVRRLIGNNTSISSEFGIMEDSIGADAVLVPGTYCKDLKIEGVNVRFLPGVYHIKGKLEFKRFSMAVGDGVTFVIGEHVGNCGHQGILKIEGDSQVKLRAPVDGPYAGIVFYQIPGNVKDRPTPRPGPRRGPELPPGATGISEIKSGGGLSIIGTAYFPTQLLQITSDSPVVSQSPATSFIAYRMIFAGKSITEVHVDHEAGGIPPQEPRSDDGARLIQ